MTCYDEGEYWAAMQAEADAAAEYDAYCRAMMQREYERDMANAWFRELSHQWFRPANLDRCTPASTEQKAAAGKGGA